MFFSINTGIGHTNTGVEHAIFNRMNLFNRFNEPNKLLSFEWFPELHDNMKRVNIKEGEVISIHDWFLGTLDFPFKNFLLGDYKQLEGFVEKPQRFTNIREFKQDGSDETTRILVRTQIDGKRVGWVEYYDPMGRKLYTETYDSRGFLMARDNFFVNEKKSELKSRIFYTPEGERRIEMTFGPNHLKEERPTFVRIFDYKEKGSVQMFDGEPEFIRFFLDEVNKYYGMYNSFIVDRGLNASWSMINMKTPSFKSSIMHSTHLSDEDKPFGLLNYHYDNEFQHIDHEIGAIVVPTTLQKDKIIKRLGNAEKFVVAPVGIIPDKVMEMDKRDADKRTNHKIVSVSRLDPIKQITHIVKALKIVKEEIPDATLDIYGVGPDKDNIEAAIKENGLEDSVKFMGHSTDLTEAYSSAQLLAAAGNNEGFGLTMMEAQSFGTPIVAYDVLYGPKEIVKPGHSGELVPMDQKDSIELYAKAIIKIMKSKTSLNKYIKGSYEDRERYSPESVWADWNNYLNLYQNWLKKEEQK